MAKATETTGASYEELMGAFGTDETKIEKRIGIKPKLVMPVPDDKPVNIRILWSKDEDGKPVAVMKKLNEKFRGGEAYFMTVEEIENPGNEKQLSLSKSLFGSMAAAAKEAKIAFDDLIGKTGSITAQWYTAAPRLQRRGVCPECHGKGCKACTVTGSGQDSGVVTGLATPTVYNFQLTNVTVAGLTGKKSQF